MLKQKRYVLNGKTLVPPGGKEKGFLRTCPGNKVHPKYVTQWFVEIRDEYGIYIPWIGYDAWSAEYWVEEMK